MSRLGRTRMLPYQLAAQATSISVQVEGRDWQEAGCQPTLRGKVVVRKRVLPGLGMVFDRPPVSVAEAPGLASLDRAHGDLRPRSASSSTLVFGRSVMNSPRCNAAQNG